MLNVVGLTRSLIGRGMPHLEAFLSRSVDIKAIVPAVTCPVQSTYLTGTLPTKHGIVANGWYFRDLAEIWFWRQSNRLVQSEKIWQVARGRNHAFTCANTFWWYAMATDVDVTLTPRPIYCADGRKLPDCYSFPSDVRKKLTQELGPFPLFHFWGPSASIRSSQWIGRAAMTLEKTFQPTLHLVYLPHLDYVLQRVGPMGEIGKDLSEIDQLCHDLIDFFCQRGCRVIVLSEYGITPAQRALHPNRILRKSGFLSLKVDLDREYLDPGTCRAFAVSDHQIAHLYIKDPKDIPAVKELFQSVEGVEQVLDAEGKRTYGLDHERSGELVLIAAEGSWFTYYFWDDDERAPDYARTVNIHAKPGYDPCELFVDPSIRFPKVKAAWTLLKKTLGFRYLMELTPLDASLVKGSHGRVTERDEEGPILMTTEPKFLSSSPVRAVDVFGLIMDHVFCD